MHVDRKNPARLGEERLEVAVVVDVLRATSTATVLLHRGLAELAVAATPEDFRRQAPPSGGYLIVSELEEAAHLGERIDNSPALARTIALAGRTPVLVTTNGTRALAAAAERAREVLVGSFLNLSALAEHLARKAPSRVTLLAAGRFDRAEERAEDELCVDALAALLAGEHPDLLRFADRCREDERVKRRLAAQAGFSDDLAVALTPDLCPVIPRFASAGAGWGWLRPWRERS